MKNFIKYFFKHESWRLIELEMLIYIIIIAISIWSFYLRKYLGDV